MQPIRAMPGPETARLAAGVLLAHGLWFIHHLRPEWALHPGTLLWQAIGGLLLAGFVPGWLLVRLLTDAPAHLQHAHSSSPTPGERLLYSIGSGFSFIIVGMMLVNFVPGLLDGLRLLLFYDAILLVLGTALWLRHRRLNAVPDSHASHASHTHATPLADFGGSRMVWIGLLLVALVGTGLRFPHLDYSEFQGDEVRAILRAAETIRGDAGAIHAHQKGPAEILIPGFIYAVGERISEAAARLPFALAGLTGLFAVFLLVRRMFNPLAGWIAAMLLSMDGYLIGFARIVQYQSLVFLMGVLTLLIFYRLVCRPQNSTRYLILAAVILAGGLLAHYETALVVLPGLFLLWAAKFWVKPPALHTEINPPDSGADAKPTGLGAILPQPLYLGIGLLPAIVTGAILLGLFYVPFVLAPDFSTTYAYIAESRIGGDFPYNNLVDFFRRTTLYSPSLYIGLLALCSIGGLVHVYRRVLPPGWSALAALGAVGGLLVVVATQAGVLSPPGPEVSTGLPAWATDPAWLVFAGAFALAWFGPGLSTPERAAWLWLGGPMVFMLFFTRTPNTHVYGFIIPWAVVAGMVGARAYGYLARGLGNKAANSLGAAAAALCIFWFGNHAYHYFAASPRETLHTWQENRLPGYWVPYSTPGRAGFSSFGFPMRNGWKAVGALYAQDALQGPIDTNDRQAVAEWYTRGAYCPRDHRYYVLSYPVEPAEVAWVQGLRADLLAQSYGLLGVVEVNGRDKIEIYQRPGIDGDLNRFSAAGPLHSAHATQPPRFPVEPFIAPFDATRTDPWFEVNGSAPAFEPEQRLDYRFGDAIHLEGYRLEPVGAPSAQGDAQANTGQRNTGQGNTEPGNTGSSNTGPEGLWLTLYWRTTAPLESNYTVFNQVLRMEDFHKIGQQDGEPGCDQFPTSGWRTDRTLVDRFYIPLDAAPLPGVYSLLSGLYDRETGDRLPIFSAQGDFLGDSVILAEIEVGE